jgi:hypothetical protein
VIICSYAWLRLTTVAKWMLSQQMRASSLKNTFSFQQHRFLFFPTSPSLHLILYNNLTASSFTNIHQTTSTFRSCYRSSSLTCSKFAHHLHSVITHQRKHYFSNTSQGWCFAIAANLSSPKSIQPACSPPTTFIAPPTISSATSKVKPQVSFPPSQTPADSILLITRLHHAIR